MEVLVKTYSTKPKDIEREWYVVDAKGRVSLRHIRVGKPLVDGRYVVLSGLSAGERVATDPQAAVRVLIEQRRGQVRHEG